MTKAKSLVELVEWANECVGRGDPTEALRPLLELYHRTHHTEVADAIDAVSLRPREGFSSPKTWMACAAKRDYRDVPELLVGIENSVARSLETRLPELEAFVRDPRIGAKMAQILREHPPQMGKQAYKRVIECLRSHLDTRATSLITDLMRRENAETVRRQLGPVKTFLKSLAADLAAVKIESPPPAPWGALKKSIAARHVDVRASTVDALFAEVYAKPDDLDARLVLADALSEVDSPRGELIVLQCNRNEEDPPSRRERELVEKHGQVWAGRLVPYVRKSHLVYRRGFLWEAALLHAGDPTLPEWRTLSSVFLDTPEAGLRALAAMLGHDGLAHLKAIHRFPTDSLVLLKGRGLTHLSVKGYFADTEQWEALHTLPALTSLAVDGTTDDLTWCAGQRRLTGRLAQFSFVPRDEANLADAVTKLAARIATVGIVATLGAAAAGSGQNFAAHATRGGAVIVRASAAHGSLALVVAFLGALPKTAKYTHLSVDLKGPAQQESAEKAAIHSWARARGVPLRSGT